MTNSNNGEYKEKIFGGGDLVVNAIQWYISYYFPGPDHRYRGTFVHIGSGSVRAEAEALLENWKELERLRSIVPNGGQYSVAGKGLMTIRIGNYDTGICLEKYHAIASTKEQAVKLSQTYLEVIERAEKIQRMLRAI